MGAKAPQKRPEGMASPTHMSPPPPPKKGNIRAKMQLQEVVIGNASKEFKIEGKGTMLLQFDDGLKIEVVCGSNTDRFLRACALVGEFVASKV